MKLKHILLHGPVACLLFLPSFPVTAGVQESGEETWIEYEGDVIEPGNDDLSRRIAIAENKVDLYIDTSRTSAKEGLELAFRDFKIWFKDYNERREPPGVELIKGLLLEAADALLLGLPSSAGTVETFGRALFGDISKEAADSGTTTRLGDTEEFLTLLEREYDEWILDEGLRVYEAFKDDALFAAAVDIYVEDFDSFTLESDGVRDDGPLRRMMEHLGVSGPGLETRRSFHECGLFKLVKHAVLRGHEVIGLTGGEPEWEFLGLDLDTYVRLEQIGSHPSIDIDWKSPYDICRTQDWR